MKAQRIIILDFGSQYTQLIARRVRELGVKSEILPCNTKFGTTQLDGVKGVILSGGPSSVTDAEAPQFDKSWIESGYPILGVCYGMQLIAHLQGGKLASGASREYGRALITVTARSILFEGFDVGESSAVWMSHGDHVEVPPSGYTPLASSGSGVLAAMGCEAKRIYALQFHPEVVHSPRGREILSNFVFKISGCSGDWSSGSIIESCVRQAQESVPEPKQAICALSGGVDSTVAAALISRALGKRLHCVFVDNGLLRKHERQQVEQLLGAAGLGLNLEVVDASEQFLSALAGVVDPEQKRKIIGRKFIEVFDEHAKRISHVTHLVQGTLYPDVIESVSPHGAKGSSVTIKSHHNVGGLPERMNLKLIEPFRELFKDEVRRLGGELGVPDFILSRHPFPGPGLAVRILGEITRPGLDLLREADAIFLEEIRSEGIYSVLWQAFAVLLPVKSVGVMGDGRTYEQTIALRAVTSEDGMTADWAMLPEQLLRRVSNRIINEVKGVNRVVYDISSKPPATIEWE